MDSHPVERIWYGRDPLARAGRGLLLPFGWLYGAVSGARNVLYDRRLLPSAEPALPAVSVGNLTAGGTGKTPLAAELAARLLRRGARPAIVLRGYGEDEPLVHQRLNPGAHVVVSADRVAGVAEARRRGADVAVLDDAFQHRRVRRLADLVLLSADRWAGDPRRPLPAGQWREPLPSLRRASLAVVTRKAVADGVVRDVLGACARVAPALPTAVARLVPSDLRQVGGGGWRPLDALRGARVLAAAAIGDPSAFARQLATAGAEVELARFRDHHRFTAEDAAELARAAERVDVVVCTLKDAVKLEPLWPRAAPPLWYVTQAVAFERGEADVDRVLDRLLEARTPPT